MQTSPICERIGSRPKTSLISLRVNGEPQGTRTPHSLAIVWGSFVIGSPGTGKRKSHPKVTLSFFAQPVQRLTGSKNFLAVAVLRIVIRSVCSPIQANWYLLLRK